MARRPALDRIDEQFLGTVAQRQIGFDNVFDHIGNFRIGNGRADQRAHLRVLVGTAADRDLVKFLAVLLDAENADVADMVMAAGVDAAGDVDVQPPDHLGGIVIGEAPGQFLRDRDRARIGQRAVIQSRAGDDVSDQVDIRRGEPDPVERLPQLRQVALGDMRQRQVLLMADTDFAERISCRRDRRPHPSGPRWHRRAGRLPASATASRSNSPAPCAGPPSSCASARTADHARACFSSSGMCGSFS